MTRGSAVNPQDWDEENEELRRTEVNTGLRNLPVPRRSLRECKQRL